MLDITTDNILESISAGESEILEFKESFGDRALEAISAFANSQGGTILIGVKDSGEICGIQVGKKHSKILPIESKKQQIHVFTLFSQL